MKPLFRNFNWTCRSCTSCAPRRRRNMRWSWQQLGSLRKMLRNTALADLLHLVNCYPASLAFGVPPTCFWFASCFDAYIVVVFSVYSTNPKAEQPHMAKFSELMKREYTPKTIEFAISQGLLMMRCTKAKKYAE